MTEKKSSDDDGEVDWKTIAISAIILFICFMISVAVVTCVCRSQRRKAKEIIMKVEKVTKGETESTPSG